MTAQQMVKELEAGKWRPFYLVVGEEPFQIGEIVQRLKSHFVPSPDDAEFNYEAWDGESLDAPGLLASLETLPGLFAGEEARRLVTCSRFEKVPASALETLDRYFRDPSPTTCFLIVAAKADKRKGWYKRVEEKGGIIEVGEPYEREWPRWQGFFERKIEKHIEPEAWERLLDSSNRKLSLLWAELQKLATYAGTRKVITAEDLRMLTNASTEADVFEFAEDVVMRRKTAAVRKYRALLREGESEIKLLSILVRQFRLVTQTFELLEKGISDPKRIATELGTPPFFVSKIIAQARAQQGSHLFFALDLLARCDFGLKTGDGDLFRGFLVPFFARSVA